MGPPDNRFTQLDIEALVGAKPPAKAAEPAVPLDFLGDTSIINRDVSSKKRARSPSDDGGSNITNSTVQSTAARPATSGPVLVRVALQSPWQKYEKAYGIEIGGPVEVAVRKLPPVKLVDVRAFSSDASAKTLHMFRQLQHPNLVTALEAFTTDSGLYVVLEHMPISLEQIVRSPAYPDERQLAAILGQIVTGVVYLATAGFDIASLSCSNILLDTDGNLKIGNQECCEALSASVGKPRSIRALANITMELMQKYVKDDGAVGVDNLHRWPLSSDAVGFLSSTTSTTSAKELLKHPLLKSPYQKESLIGIISLAQVCMRGRYKYTPRE